MLHLAQISPLVCRIPACFHGQVVVSCHCKCETFWAFPFPNGKWAAFGTKISCKLWLSCVVATNIRSCDWFYLDSSNCFEAYNPQKKNSTCSMKSNHFKRKWITFQPSIFRCFWHSSDMLRSLTLLALAHNVTSSKYRRVRKKLRVKKKKTKKMTLQRPSWTKKTKKNSTVARLPKPLPGRNSFSLAVGWAVFAGVRSTEWNRSYTWGKRSRRCNFWGVLGGGVAKRGKFDVSNGRKWKIYYGFGLCEKVASRRQQLYIETNY